jgi:hypothetical protein
LSHKADATAQDNVGDTPLHLASDRSFAQGGHDIIQLLLLWGAKVNVANNALTYPLHNSVRFPELVAVLLHAKADVDVVNADNQTAAQLSAAQNGASCLAVSRLLEARADGPNVGPTSLRAIMQSVVEVADDDEEVETVDLLDLMSAPDESVSLTAGGPGGAALQPSSGATKRCDDDAVKNSKVPGGSVVVPEAKLPVTIMLQDDADGDAGDADDTVIVHSDFSGHKGAKAVPKPKSSKKKSSKKKSSKKKSSKKKSSKKKAKCAEPQCAEDDNEDTWSVCRVCDKHVCHNHALDHGRKCKRRKRKETATNKTKRIPKKRKV